MAQPGYIFIGGSSRTGTSLLRCILNTSEEVAICDETHFLGDPKTGVHLLRNILNRFNRVAIWAETQFLQKLTDQGRRGELAEVGDIFTEAGAKQIVDFIYDTCPRWAPKNVARGEFLQRLLESDRTDRALFDLTMACYADGKPIRGEKTPAHIHYLPLLFEWCPNAKLIHTFRDPRVIFVLRKKEPFTRKSLTRRYRILRRFGPIFDLYLSLNVIINWLRVVQLHDQYRRLYPNKYFLLKYENMISDPETYLKRLCDFLEINFTEKMLQRALQDPDFALGRQIQADILASSYWQTQLHPVVRKAFDWLCGKHLVTFGYRL